MCQKHGSTLSVDRTLPTPNRAVRRDEPAPHVLKRTDSNSRAMADHEAREAMLVEVEALIDERYDGWIVRPLTASLVMARRR